MARRRRRLTALRAAAATALLAGCAGAVNGTHALTSDRNSTPKVRVASSAVTADLAIPPLPADCIPKPGIQIQLGAYATFSGSFTVDGPYGPELSAGVSGSFCGIGTVVNPPRAVCPAGTSVATQLYVPADGQTFHLPGVDITMVPGVTPEVEQTTVVPQPITAVVCAVVSTGPLQVDLTASISAAAGLFGASCVIGPLDVPLRGSIDGPLSDFQFTFGSGPFGIPAATPTARCPSSVTTALNSLFTFPLSVGSAHISLSGTGEVYQESE